MARGTVSCVSVVWVGKQWMENADKKSRNQASKNQIKAILDPSSIKQIELDTRTLPEFMSWRGGLQKRDNQNSCISLCQVQYSRFSSFPAAIHNLQGITRPLISYLPKDPLRVTMHSEPLGQRCQRSKTRSVVQYSCHELVMLWVHSLPWFPVFKFNCFLLHKYPHSGVYFCTTFVAPLLSYPGCKIQDVTLETTSTLGNYI